MLPRRGRLAFPILGAKLTGFMHACTPTPHAFGSAWSAQGIARDVNFHTHAADSGFCQLQSLYMLRKL